MRGCWLGFRHASPALSNATASAAVVAPRTLSIARWIDFSAVRCHSPLGNTLAQTMEPFSR